VCAGGHRVGGRAGPQNKTTTNARDTFAGKGLRRQEFPDGPHSPTPLQSHCFTCTPTGRCCTHARIPSRPVLAAASHLRFSAWPASRCCKLARQEKMVGRTVACTALALVLCGSVALADFTAPTYTVDLDLPPRQVSGA
jgi:hypothetical protein